MSTEKELYDCLYDLADVVIHVEEMTPEEAYKKEVFIASQKDVKAFFKQVDDKIAACKDEEEKNFVKHECITFLIASLKKIVVTFDLPDELIDMIAEDTCKQIKEATRREYEKTNENL